MNLNIGDTKTKLLLGLAKTPWCSIPTTSYHLPLPTVLMIENTNHCNAECVMCPRDTLSRKRGFMDFGLFEKIIREASSEKRKAHHAFARVRRTAAGQAAARQNPARKELRNHAYLYRLERFAAVSRDIEEDHQRGAGQDEDQLLRHRRSIVQQHHEAAGFQGDAAEHQGLLADSQGNEERNPAADPSISSQRNEPWQGGGVQSLCGALSSIDRLAIA